ncbi:MAG: type II secretion system protein GspG [Candidatus Omnitrophica bacterium]|nr:type II secretion system protein GspG [Candidatus Omnitrophota bacterium]
MDHRLYPPPDEGLKALIAAPSTDLPKWHGPYLKKKTIPKDPWGHDYVYLSPGKHNTDSFDLYSYGPDGVEGKDDIANWSENNP